MGASRVAMDRLQDLVRYHRLGQSRRRMQDLLKMSRNTIAPYLEAFEKAGILDGDPNDLPSSEALKAAITQHAPAKAPPQQTSSVAAWDTEIAAMIERGARPQAIYDCLKLKDGFRGSRSAVKRAYARLRGPAAVKPEDVAIPIAESKPGERAQVDFGYVGRIYDPDRGVQRRAWVFVMVLSFSRHQFARIVFDQTAETWITLHLEAFAFFGGVPWIITPDNLKAAVVRAAFGAGGAAALNRAYREFARHYGFLVDPTPPNDPEKKGTVEAGVKYVKRNFFKPRDLSTLDAVSGQRELERWVIEIAGQRIHGTMRWRPLAVFEEVERASLAPLPAAAYEPVIWQEGKVLRDSHVVFDRRLYSAPYQLIGRQVWMRVTRTTVVIFADEERVATHDRRGPGGRSTIDAHLPPHRVEFRHRNPEYWISRADGLGADVGVFVREVLASDDVLCMLRTVQSIVAHLESFPVERAQAACRRASLFGSYSYKSIKDILKRGLDLEPLSTRDGDHDLAQGQLVEPRHARSPSEFAATSGVIHAQQ